MHINYECDAIRCEEERKKQPTNQVYGFAAMQRVDGSGGGGGGLH